MLTLAVGVAPRALGYKPWLLGEYSRMISSRSWKNLFILGGCQVSRDLLKATSKFGEGSLSGCRLCLRLWSLPRRGRGELGLQLLGDFGKKWQGT